MPIKVVVTQREKERERVYSPNEAGIRGDVCHQEANYHSTQVSFISHASEVV